MCYVCFSQEFCEKIFSDPAFSSCQNYIDVDYFITACQGDMCCNAPDKSTFLCQTISEYSRECVHAGGTPQQWRHEKFCRKFSLIRHSNVSTNKYWPIQSIFLPYVISSSQHHKKKVCFYIRRQKLLTQHGVQRVHEFLSWHVLQSLCQSNMWTPLPRWMQLSCRCVSAPTHTQTQQWIQINRR